ncbi:MAG TPA: ATP-binding protein [Lentisphaeria bacterium]|nr:MAG: hypothetical protein A2X47_04280 [Lentisphaerae bacterium GWF2_38_69]HBM16208.1 ATP-binding protein [Lentisphaeria bacterium]
MFQVIREKAELVHLNFFLKSIRDFIEKAGASEEKIFDVILTAEEILVNIMSYAYPENQKGEIEIHCQILEADGEKKLKCVFIDEGKFFDILQKESPDLSAPIETRSVGGLGIHLVKTLMDEVSYMRQVDKNILSVVKTI